MDNANIVIIPLGKGYSTVIDAIDSDVMEEKWSVLIHSDELVYVRRQLRTPEGKLITIMLHRVILSRMEGRPLIRSELTDHINRDGLDNRRENLRLATYAQNMHNQRLPSNNSSGYKGVKLDKRTGKWAARIGINGTQKWLGYYDKPTEAYAAYCEAAREYYGEFARL